MKKQKLFRRPSSGKLFGLAFAVLFGFQYVFGQAQNSIQQLEANRTLEREMAGPETHRYKFDLQKDEFFQVRVEQKGIDVTLKLLDAGGNVLATMDSPNGKEGPETLSYIATKASHYTLEVISFNEKAEKGSYTIQLKNSQTATAQDKRRIEAERAFVEGMIAQRIIGQSETAVAKFEEALAGWQELKDDYLAQMTARQVERAKELRDRTDVRRLPIGEVFERQLKGGERHFYVVELNRGQVFRIDTQGKGIDVQIAFGRASDRQAIARADFGFGPDRDYDIETLTAIAEQAGSYAVLIESPPSPLSGSYQLLAQVKEEAAAADIDRIRAARLLEEGFKTANKKTKSSLEEAIVKLEEALASWQELQDEYWAQLTATRIQQIKLRLDPLDSMRELPVGKTVERQIKSGESHQYLFRLEQGQVLQVEAEEKGANVRILLNKYDNKLPLTIADFGSGDGRETLTVVAEEAGLYAIMVALRALLPSGSYQLRSQIKESATAADIDRIKAEQLLAEGIARERTGNAPDLRQAITRLEESALLWRKLGEKYWESFSYSFLGRTYDDIGEKPKALGYYDQVLTFRRSVGDKRGEASALSNIGLLYSDLGEHQKALDYYNTALSIKKDNDDISGEATTLNNIGAVYVNLGKIREAIEYFDKALKLFSKNKDGEAAALNNIGGAYLRAREAGKALEYFNKALPIVRELNDRRKEAGLLNNMGLAYFELGKMQEAIGYYKQALPTVKAMGNKDAEVRTLTNLLSVSESLGARRLAIFFGKQAVNKVQQLRGFMQRLDSEVQKAFLRNLKDPYQHLITTLIKDGQLEQAVQILNLYQDQQFFDFDHNRNSPVQETVLSPREQALAKRYETAGENIGRIGSQIENLRLQPVIRQANEQEIVQMQNLEAELKAAFAAFSSVLDDAEKEFAKPSDERDKISTMRDVAEIQAALLELGATTKQKTVALYTFIGRDEFHILLLTPQGEVKAFQSPIDMRDLNRKILQFYALLQTPSYDPSPLGKELYEIIFKPVEAELKKMGAQTLMWSLYGNLRYVPMAALWDGEKHLVERYQNVVFTRASKERMIQPVSPSWTGYGFATSAPHNVELLGNSIAFSPLDFAGDEMKVFRTASYPAGVIDGEVFSNANFNKESLLAALKQKRPLVHISSHFSFHPGDSSRSFLLLGNGQIMTLAEMKEQANLFQGVELLTLSACNTAAQHPDATGREIDGFAELAQRIGAGAVMASLWPVKDRSTSLLMKEFYKNRQDQKSNKAEALRKSQLGLLYGRSAATPLSSAAKNPPTSIGQSAETTRRAGSLVEDIVLEKKYRILFEPDKNKPYAHPHYWSPFVLFGNWK